MRKSLVALCFMLFAITVTAAPKPTATWEKRTLSSGEKHWLIAAYVSGQCEVQLLQSSPLVEPGSIWLVGKTGMTKTTMMIDGSGRITGTTTYRNDQRVDVSRDVFDPPSKETPIECIRASGKADWPSVVRWQLENIYTRDDEYRYNLERRKR